MMLLPLCKLHSVRFITIPVRRYSIILFWRTIERLIEEQCDVVFVFLYPHNRPYCVRISYLLPEHYCNRIDFFSLYEREDEVTGWYFIASPSNARNYMNDRMRIVGTRRLEKTAFY